MRFRHTDWATAFHDLWGARELAYGPERTDINHRGGYPYDAEIDVLESSLTLRLFPFLEFVSFEPDPNRDHDPSVFAVVPVPVDCLRDETPDNLLSYFRVIEERASDYAGLIVAEAGHDWRRCLGKPFKVAPYMPVPPEAVVCFRADTLLGGNDANRRAMCRGQGDTLENELREAAEAVGLPFYVDLPDVPESEGEQ